jgi:PPE-repeat protein
MDYLFSPPEVNSTRMYAGPGAGSLLTAAGTWDAVSAELSTTAEGYTSVLSNLTGLEWLGPASQSMMASAAGYIRWLQTTSEQAKQTAMQARTAAAAYEQAYAMTVPPTAVATNRSRLMTLIATNYLGQNTSQIAQIDAQYADYWAQDATAMSNYDSSATSARQLQKFNNPNNSTNESGTQAQNNSVTVANNTANSSTSAVSAIAGPLQSLLGANPIIPEDATLQDEILAGFAGVNSTYNIEAFVSGVIGAENNLGILPDLGAAAAAPAEIAPALASAPVAGGAGLGSITATLSGANTIGPMSVPASWSAPSATRIATLQPAGMTTLPGTVEEAATSSGYPGYPGMPGAGVSRGSGVGVPPRYGVRLTVMPRPPAAG